MKGLKTTSVAVVALALLTVGAHDAAAQAPTVTVSVNGSTVNISWTSLVGATGYNIVVSGTLSGQLQVPASTTSAQVNAPAGTYTLQVQGFAGSQVGPLSNAATFTVGGSGGLGPCTGTPAAPAVTVQTSGGNASVSWTPIPGAVGYRVELSRVPGGTELAQTVGANVTSFSQYIPMVGTFYVRIVVGTACGNATSADTAFTIGSLVGAGPRTPDPPAGQVLPRPTYGQDVVVAMALAYPGDLRNSCHEFGGNNVFMFRVLQALRQRDSRWGLNIKRGNQGLSQDVVTYNPTAGPDEGATRIYLWDMIGGHCGNNPTWNWADVTQATRDAGARGECSNSDCARWTLTDYLRAGFQP